MPKLKKEELPVAQLTDSAIQELKYCYAPYSGFRVAAALLTDDGSIYKGCNIENAAYTPSNCAERTAFFKAVSDGVRGFQAICIVNEANDGSHCLCPPCGVCMQVMMEFVRPEEFYIILAKNPREYEIYTLKELLPRGFGPGNLA